MTASLPTVLPDGTWHYTGTIVGVHDGDTCTVRLLVDVGFEEQVTLTRTLRLLGIDAPELSTPAGKVAAQYAQATWPVGTPVQVFIVGYDKFAPREDARVQTLDGSLDWSADMLAHGYAKPYDGGKRG